MWIEVGRFFRQMIMEFILQLQEFNLSMKLKLFSLGSPRFQFKVLKFWLDVD